MSRSRSIKLLLTFFIIFSVFSCGTKHNKAGLDDFSKNQLHVWNKQITDVMIADIFTPPVCSRIYVYPNIAAYEALTNEYSEYRSLKGQLKELEVIPKPSEAKEYFFPLASIIAFSTTGKKMVFAEEKIEAFEVDYLKKIQEVGIDKTIFENSVSYGREVGNAILDWANKDGYIERQALPRHILNDKLGSWQPTPPDYLPGIEPHWNTLRTFVIDSASQFVPPPPTLFDTLPNSPFYQEALEVYEAVKTARMENGEKMEIAKFWDCNPNVSYTKGHVMFFHQKISPGGHWMSIASTAIKKADLGMMEQSEVFTRTSIALADAFISCWDEKYRSDLIRPETYIDAYIEQGWEPILQTPAFPEYTSGHSVASRAASTTLTNLLGDNFSYTDSTEVQFGLPARDYDSFYQASDEAAISRMYGGIHYSPACFNGVEQGRQVGEFVFANLVTKDKQQVAEK
ncbi:MAG: vanadium-dependent haloperoxidase [Bacteroidota bacterium]